PRNSSIDLPKVDKSQNEEIKETEIEEEAESEAEKEPQIVGLSIGFEQTPITAETVEKDAQSVKESTQEVKESTQEVKEEAKEEIKKVAKPTKATKREITVKSGDNLWNLAKKHNVKRSEIIKLNNLKPPYNLRVGQKLKLP
ncbi:MAG: LysM peptidoglycan-binding domain-containing protein, partial [Proteobacteria bacterium]|nr:LysM peptidoglycan-binding domain-containing protein [Pseudomonadota bacterium]